MRLSAEPSREALRHAAADKGPAETAAGAGEKAAPGEICGRVLRIEKTSIHDGDGLRTVVFFKGCPLRCKWCSTPESQSGDVTELYGKRMSVSQVMKEIRKDEIFFFHSGGGVTLSGGEVLLQPEFACSILRSCMEEGIETAIETSLYADFSKTEMLLPFLTSMFVDFKLYEEEEHRCHTGVSNRLILENMEKLSKQYSGHVVIRIPTVPGVNMTEENMRRTAEFLLEHTRFREVELLPYHRLGLESYRKLNRIYELENTPVPKEEELLQMAKTFAAVSPEFRIFIKGRPAVG